MLNGNYEHCLDDKFRARIPSKLKKDLGSESPVVAEGIDKCLYIYPAARVDAMNNKFMSNPPKNKAELLMMRKFLSSMFTLGEDNQGRFVLPTVMREYAGIVKDIVFVGVIDHIEVWAKERWDSYVETINEEDYDSALINFMSMGG